MTNINQEIRDAFNSAAITYTDAAKVQCEIGRRLLARLDYFKINPRFILDLGCGPGVLTSLLQARYPDACVVGLDLAFLMLQQAKSSHPLLVHADMCALPFNFGSFDLVFANQVIHWAPCFKSLLQEIHRVMRIDGCFMFSTLGPDTMDELKQAFAAIDGYAHTHDFVDMHERGDALLAAQFIDPVMDMEHLTVHYQKPQDLLWSIKAQGVRNLHEQRRLGLMGKVAWGRLLGALEAQKTPEGQYPLTYEVIYGHAWKGAQQRNDDGETFFSLDGLLR